MRSGEFLELKNATKIASDFADLWLRKYYPKRKQTKVIDLYYEWDSLAVYYNRKIDGYDSNHFDYSYIVDFMRDAGMITELKKAE